MKDATQFHIRPARPEEAGLFYAQHPEEDKRLGAVGCVRNGLRAQRKRVLAYLVAPWPGGTEQPRVQGGAAADRW